jgi:long-chain acyl-CoA synthetase
MIADARSIGQLLSRLASEAPDKVAITFEGRTTTRASLDRRASQVAHGLIALTSESGARLAVLDTNSDAFFELLFGAAKSRRILVPINYRLTVPEVIAIVCDAGAQVLFVGAEFFPIAEAIREHCPTVGEVITLGGTHDGWPTYEVWRDQQRACQPDVAVDPSDDLLLVYTSGTTGRPKGVQLTHANVLQSTPLLVQEYGPSPGDDVALVCMPLFHVSGSLWGLSCLHASATIVMLRRINPAEVLQTIDTHRISKALLVPAVIRLLLETPDIHSCNLTSLDFVLYGGSPISMPLLRQAMATFKCHFGQVYGLTEATGAITYLSPSDHEGNDPALLQSCGKPLAHVQVRVLDEAGRELPPGAIGEIVCRSAQTMKGYWNNPEQTAEVLRDGWLYTGDAGYFDSDGYLHVHDRVKDMIVSGGENIYPAELERTLMSHVAVVDVAVIGIPDNRWGEVPLAFVVRKSGCETAAEELIAFCRERMASYKTPKAVTFVDGLPRNAAGKLLKHELRAPFWPESRRQVN